MKEKIIEKIIDFFRENEEIFACCIEELDSYNGFLQDGKYFFMEDIDEFYRNTDPLELLMRAFYGHDADTWTTDSSGNKIYGEFNPNRNYFYYNAYGNLVSSDYKDYTDYLYNYTVEEMSENRCYIYSIEDNEELKILFEELEKEAEKQDESLR